MRTLAGSPVGSVVRIRGTDHRFGEAYDVEAFLPAALPRSLTLPTSTWSMLTEAAAELGRLDAAAALIPNPQLVTRVATRREAIGTSALEGTFAALTELFAAEALPLDQQGKGVPANVREVMNYTRAADRAASWVQDRPITAGLLSELQREIVRGTASDGEEAGDIRTTQVFIGARNRRIREARFIPSPPGDQLRMLFDDWLSWVQVPPERSEMPLLVQVALAHYQFETIHPYHDGNGRLGRLIVVLQLMRSGALRAPVLSVSPWLKDHAERYRDHLLEISHSGDWAPWVEFFAEAIAVQARDGHDRIMQLLALSKELGERVRAELPKARLAVEIADSLIAYPILSVAAAQARHGRTNQANRNAITSLCDLGVLEPFGDASYDRLFWNRQVFRIIDD